MRNKPARLRSAPVFSIEAGKPLGRMPGLKLVVDTSQSTYP